MKLIRSISLVLLCIAFVPSLALGQTAEIDALKEKAEKEDATAQFNLGVKYHAGEGVPQDYAEAVKWYRMAAVQGHAPSQSNLGLMYERGDGVPENDVEAVKWFRKAAEQGHVSAQFNVGISYANGKGVLEDDTEAVKWYRKAAEQGHVSAQLALGFNYAKGEGVPKDEAEEFKWYKRAAEQGSSKAQRIVGFLYANGEGVTEDDAEAVKWFRKAAEQGDVYAQFNLGLHYDRGLAIPESDAEAVKWYRKAAEQGLPLAQNCLGLMYAAGEGVPEDDAEAVKWYRKAAEQGNGDGQGNLGHLYAAGEGVPENYVQAYMWMNLAAAQGVEFAKSNKKIIAKKMTPQQIAEAQKLSAAFKPRKEIPNKAGGTTTRSEVSTSLPDSFGSGFYVTSNGYLLTNQHVVDGARKVFIYSGSQRLPARVVKTDAANDLALLKVSGTFAALPVSSSRRVKLGQTVSTVGFPNPDLQGKSPKLTKGEISSLSGASDDPKYFQISVPVQPGNSGGPLVDAYGNVIGVVTAKLRASTALAKTGNLPENVNYAVKGTFVMGFLESVPDVAAEMLNPKPRRSREFTEVVSEAEKASVMILVYE